MDLTRERIQLPHDHGDDAQAVLDHIPDEEGIVSVADSLKQLGDPSRLKIFWILCHCEECVINIAAMTKMSSPAVSHHLRILKTGGLITSRREGKEMYYKAADTQLAHLLLDAIDRISELPE